MNKIKQKSIITITISSVILFIFIISFIYRDTYVFGEEHGLRVSVSQNFENTDNLCPGDTKESTITISIDRQQASPLPIYMKSAITNTSSGKGGGELDDMLLFTLKNANNSVLYNGPISGFNNFINVGSLSGGQSMVLTFSMSLPRETDNSYQVSSMTIKWIVMTEGDSTPTPTPTSTPDEFMYVIDPTIPGATPQTGELLPALYYIFGGLVASLGIVIYIKKSNPKSF